jgi:hypothetical protein
MPRLIARSVAFALAALLAAPSFAQQGSSDGIAGSLGAAMAVAAMCGRSTAPVEAELERYIKKVGAGPLEADRLRKVMLRDGDYYRRVVGGSFDCRKADEGIAGTIANVRAATR